MVRPVSVKVSSWVWEHSQAKGNDRLVLLCIADIADADGEATSHARSLRYIATKTRLARSTVQERVRSLVELGELEVLEAGGGRTQSGYRVLMGVPESGTPDPEAPSDSGTQPTGEPVRRVPATGTQATDGPVPHHPVLIPTSSHPDPTAPLTLVPDDADDLFDRFWRLYPRKIDKPGSKRKFKKALKTATAMEISFGLKRWLAHWDEVDPQFIPHPATWLNQQRWNDEPPQAKRREAPMPKSADTILEWAAE